MKIGEIAATTNTPVETIRYYEREGLMPEAARSQSNYRVYDSAQVERLAFIRRCRGLDMTLDEVRALLRFIDQPGPDCGDVNALLDEHIGHVTQRIAELRKLEKELRLLRAQCDVAGAANACGILKGLVADAPEPATLATPAGRRPAQHGHGKDLHRRQGARGSR